MSRYQCISEADQFDVEYWSLEQAKLGKAAEKKLAGAAKTSFLKKCEKDAAKSTAGAACAAKAVDKNGKPLAGAAKASFVKKCLPVCEPWRELWQ